MVLRDRPPHRIALRLLQILDAIERAGFAPVSFRTLHSFAYLGNLLAPLWEVDPLDGKILKQGYPYYPELREAIDAMIFKGLVELTSFEAVRFDDAWVGEGEVGLQCDAARPIIDQLDLFEDERQVRDFLLKLALAVAPRADELADLVMSDVTWTDTRVGKGDVLDYAEYRQANYTLNATQAFDSILPKEMASSKGEKLQFYVHLLERRAAERVNVKRSA